MPEIKERMGVSALRGNPQLQPDHLLANRDEGYCLVSYAPLPDFKEHGTYYGGFCWDLEALKKETLPGIFGKISKETGLALENVEESRPGTLAARRWRIGRRTARRAITSARLRSTGS